MLFLPVVVSLSLSLSLNLSSLMLVYVEREETPLYPFLSVSRVLQEFAKILCEFSPSRLPCLYSIGPPSTGTCLETATGFVSSGWPFVLLLGR